ncbi:hypothetical protein HYH03_017850 [Edaphochlamys debaryana]|uniref:Uncharacterized protein n=1 Tax=Edaphochlamys debaryana TaxID=47281 RepID=A0A836BNW3_9CHLO|nr:hypothetical protein HYH03_017850 [Edaphochlamys debaryana]|eukprot:KAG2483252.1 hypothetical protein HYH03_017850 [Edaphochlamys debaryana]
MDLEPVQKSASESCSLADVLHVLSSDARDGLVDALGSNSSLRNARLACRALRDLIDSQQTALTVNTYTVSYGDLVTLCHDGRWLRRWPRCTKLTLLIDGGELGALAVPFLAAPLDACQRITELAVSTEESETALPGSHVLALVSRLPGLCKLVLSATAPEEDDSPLEFSLTQMALSSLPSLTDLTANWTYLPCIPGGLAGQLTRLELTPVDSSDRPPAANVAEALPGMTAVRELVFAANAVEPFTPAEILELLNAAPPSLTHMQVNTVEARGLSLRFTFSNSLLDSVHVGTSWANSDHAGPPWAPKYADVAARLAAAVLPSRALGPRLGLLSISHLTVSGSLPDPDPAAALLARCAKVELGALKGSSKGSPRGAISLMRKLGVPRSLEWDAGRGLLATVSLTEPKPGADKRRPVLELRTVVESVVQRMASSAGAPDSILLLRGPFMRGLLSVPAGLRPILRHLISAPGVSPPLRTVSCRALPAAGAVVLGLRLHKSPAAAAEAARRLAEAAGGGPEAAGVVMLEVLCPSLPLEAAIQQELQALWDGDVDGEERGVGATTEEQAKADVGGGAGAEAGPTSGSSAGGGGGGPMDELDRVRCLLETWDRLRAWISDVDLAEPRA